MQWKLFNLNFGRFEVHCSLWCIENRSWEGHANVQVWLGHFQSCTGVLSIQMLLTGYLVTSGKG